MRYLLIIFILFLYSCKSQNNNSQENFKEVQFNVDTLLISESYLIDNNFKLSIPKSMFQDKKIFNVLNNHIESDTSSYFKFNLIETFNNENILLYIGKIDEENLFNKLDSNYNKALKETYQVENFNIGQYNVNNLNIFQYIFTDDKSVTIKLYINNLDKFYEITYIVNKIFYENYLKHIESSIGSIKSI